MDSFNSRPPLTEFQLRMKREKKCIHCGAPASSQMLDCSACRDSARVHSSDPSGIRNKRLREILK